MIISAQKFGVGFCTSVGQLIASIWFEDLPPCTRRGRAQRFITPHSEAQFFESFDVDR